MRNSWHSCPFASPRSGSCRISYLRGRVSQNKNGERGNIRLQKWTSFPNYFPQQMWDEMRDLNRVDALKLMLLKLIRLGLRHPSCPTYGVMAAVSSVIELGADQTLILSRDQKLQRVNLAKSPPGATPRNMQRCLARPELSVFEGRSGCLRSTARPIALGPGCPSCGRRP